LGFGVPYLVYTGAKVSEEFLLHVSTLKVADEVIQEKIIYIYIYIYITGKKGRKKTSTTLLHYLKQVSRNTGVDSNTAMKRMACNNSRWKAANQLKD